MGSSTPKRPSNTFYGQNLKKALAKIRNFNFRAKDRKMIRRGALTHVALSLTAFLLLTAIRSQVDGIYNSCLFVMVISRR